MTMPSQILPGTISIVEKGVETNLHSGAQIYVSRSGRPLVEYSAGESRAGIEMTPDILMLWMSSCKPITAVAIGQLWERNRLHWDDVVSEFIPEFACNGKDAVTIRHLLTHTCGFRSADTGWKPESWEDLIRRICLAPLEEGWVPGERAGYHLNAGWYVLGEIIQRTDGRLFSEYVREEILEPCGCSDSWIGMPYEKFRAYGDRMGAMHVLTNDSLQHLSFYDSEEAVVMPRPGSNGRGPARELGRFYEMLLADGYSGDKSILKPETVRQLTARHRIGLYDETFRHKMDWGLGFIPDNNRYGVDTVPYGYGPHCSSATFGHSGSQSSTAFADPERDLVAAIVFNGMPGEPRHQQRIRAVTSAIYEDLELADGRDH